MRPIFAKEHSFPNYIRYRTAYHTVNLEKCCYCGDMTDMPFQCNYCKDFFCPEHRLPEEHRCVKLTLIRARKFGEKRVIRDGGTGKKSLFRRFFGR